MKHAQGETTEREFPQLVALAVKSLQVAHGAQVEWVQVVVAQVQLGHLAYNLQTLTVNPLQLIQPGFTQKIFLNIL